MKYEEKIALQDLLSKLKSFNDLEPSFVSKVLMNASLRDNENSKIFKEILALASTVWYNNSSIDDLINQLND